LPAKSLDLTEKWWMKDLALSCNLTTLQSFNATVVIAVVAKHKNEKDRGINWQMKNNLILIFIIIALLGKSQSKINGYVVDKNNNPISNVNIFFKYNQAKGTISNKEGYFEISTQNDSLIFLHLIYKTLTIKPDSSNIIILSKKSYLLNEVVISSEKSKLVIKNPWIIDYEISNNNIYLAYVSNSGPIIEIRDFNNNILYQENQKDFISFQKDCLGNIYLHIAKEYYLIEFKEFYYKVINTYSEKEFNEIKYSCDAKIKDYQFYNYFINEKYNLIFNYNTTTNNYLLLTAIADKKDIHYITELERKNSQNLIKLKDINKEINTYKILGKETKDLNYDVYRLKNEINQDFLFKNLIQKKKIISPIFEINDTIYIFDNVNNAILTYLFNGTFLNNTLFSPPFSNPIFIVQDINNSNIFYFYNLKNKIEVYKYNIVENNFEHNISLPNKIEKPIISNNELYYIEYDKETKLLKKQWLN